MLHAALTNQHTYHIEVFCMVYTKAKAWAFNAIFTKTVGQHLAPTYIYLPHPGHRGRRSAIFCSTSSYLCSAYVASDPLTQHWPLLEWSPSLASCASGQIPSVWKHPRRPWAQKSRTCGRGPQLHTCLHPCPGCIGTSSMVAGRATQRFG